MAAMTPAIVLAAGLGPAAPCDADPERPISSARRASEHAAPRRPTATPPGTTLTFPWLVTQLLPSPELAVGDDGAAFGLRWQIVPFLYSFGIDPRLSPFRAL